MNEMTTSQPPAEVQAGYGFWATMAEAFREPGAMVGLTIVAFITIITLASGFLEPYPLREASCPVFAPPSLHHWFGCDDGGIDVFSLVLHGGRISLLVGTCSAVIAIGLGGAIGIVSGYFGGWTDVILMRITDYFLVVPQIPLMIVIAAVWGASISHVILTIGILMWTSTARLVRSQVMSLKERSYVRRVESLGAGHTRIIFHHILPQLGPLLVANTVLAITVAIFNETALSFLGLSDPDAITWGSIMTHAFNRAAISSGAWWAIVPAGMAVALITTGGYLIGRAIEDALNPRLRISYLSPREWKLLPTAQPRKGANG
ncbi:ABC transporter permease [Acidocella sp.]|uniref:ABC transporter permease n=1 Tax=Acidocella sp. TaxID=50710 RepID=UPI002604EBA2|nr:ABC transporter permease [Acidocella sp.]